MSTEYSIEFPDYFDDYSIEIESKGYFDDLAIVFNGKRIRPVVYDAYRLSQECDDAFSVGESHFSVSRLIVVPRVTREHIIAAVDALAEGDFVELVREEDF